MRTSPIISQRARLSVIAALLTATLSACSGGGATAPLGSAATPANGIAQSLSNDAVLASPAGYVQLVDIPAPKTGYLKSFSPPTTDTVLFHDDFNSGVATGWSIAQGTWSVPPSTYEYAATGAQNLALAGSSTWTNYGVEAYFRPENSSGSRRGTVLIARAIDANHYYQVEFANESDGNHWEIWRNDGGNWKNLASGKYPYVDDHQYLVQLKVFGSNISVSIADNYDRQFSNVASVTDSTYTHGRIGLRVWGGATSRLDDVRVWTPSASTPAPSAAPIAVAAATASPASTQAPTPAPTAAAYVLPAGGKPFPNGPANPFNVAVSNPQIDANSATLVRSTLSTSSYGTDFHSLGQVQVSTHALSQGPTDSQTTTYLGHNSDPAYTIHCMDFSNCPLEGHTVHIPVGAIAGGNLGFTSFTDTGHDDQHMAIRNDDTQEETDMWLAPLPSGHGGTLNIGYGGLFPYSSGGAGQGGATAAGFALAQGHIRPVDLTAGRIPYAIFMSTPCENGHVYPAIGDDGEHIGGCPPIGSHLWLDSTPAEIAASGANRYWKVVMNGLHEFGGYIGDHASANLSVAPEGGVAYQAFGATNPWASIIASDFPSETTSGSQGEYHLSINTGNIDLSLHLHVIDN